MKINTKSLVTQPTIVASASISISLLENRRPFAIILTAFRCPDDFPSCDGPVEEVGHILKLTWTNWLEFNP